MSEQLDIFGSQIDHDALVEQLDEWTGPFVRNEHPQTAHAAAEATVERDGGMGQVRRDSHRHKVLLVFAEHPEGLSQINAGKHAYHEHGVGVGTQVGDDVGRRRCSDLEGMGLLKPAHVPHDGQWVLSDLGRSVLRHLETKKAAKVPLRNE